jgi:hypothetical protein
MGLKLGHWILTPRTESVLKGKLELLHRHKHAQIILAKNKQLDFLYWVI